jgi:hypothetical protein
VNRQRTTQQFTELQIPASTRLANSYYAILGLHPSASAIEIRRAYREMSKRYHPDTTKLSLEVAKAKFQQLNEAYATLSNPDRRSLYDLKIGYSRWNVIQTPLDLERTAPQTQRRGSNSAYLDPTDRPLSAGEIFVLFILALTFVGCLLLVVVVGLLRGETSYLVSMLPSDRSPLQESIAYLPASDRIINFPKPI